MTIGGLTTKEAAKRLNVADVTVRLWCRQGRFPNARALDTPRGSIWYIPAKDLKGFRLPQLGRPTKTTNKNTTIQSHTKEPSKKGKMK